MKHLGDITKIDGAVVEPVEVVIGGSPCQDLSVAGKREGLGGERSGLFMEQIRIIKEMRRKDIESGAVNPRPRYMVWENVPGVFSSNKGEDFKIVLEETARICEPTAVIPRPPCGWTNSGAIMGVGWSIAWRVHDAQFWGVPQRRRRIALVADFGGYAAPEILFERNSLSRNTPPSATTWENFAGAIAKHFGGSNRSRRTADRQERVAVMYDGANITSEINHSNPQPGKCHTLTASCARRSYCVQGRIQNKNNDLSYVFDARGNGDGNIVPTITGDHNNRITDYTALTFGIHSGLVIEKARRITPLECERLQGFPDGWTDIGSYINSKGRRKETTDTQRYGALGRSIALPPWAWILERLSFFCTEHTMASVFDGIGGFPLIWETLNGEGSCLWASEIEEFPIAVTKYHFGG